MRPALLVTLLIPLALSVQGCTPARSSNQPLYAEEDFNTESYSRINENTFRSATLDPLSTFSIDVDSAAYSNIRRFISRGQVQPLDEFRLDDRSEERRVGLGCS